MPTRVFVHIIQALNLICEDDSLPIPLATVECFNSDRTTPKMKERTYSPFWDCNFVFVTELAQLQGQDLTIRVYNSDSWIKNKILGQFVFELSAVHEQPNHEYYRQWCVLSTEDDETACKGWLKCSVIVLLDGDLEPQHTIEEQEDPFADPATDDAETLQDAILKPPALKYEGFLLRVNIYEAIGLPRDSWFSTTDAFIGIKFAAGKELKGPCIKNNLNPAWMCQLIIPVKVPAVADTVRVSLYDSDLFRDSLLSMVLISFNQIRELGKLPPRYYHFYGHPGISVKAAIEEAMDKGEDEPERTKYCGKILMSFELESVVDLKSSYNKDRAIVKGIPDIKRPETADYVLWADLYQGCVCRSGSVYVQVEWGRATVRSRAVPVRAGEQSVPISWFELLKPLQLTDALDLDHIPMIVVNLMVETLVGEDDRVAFTVIDPRTFTQGLTQQPNAPGAYKPTWQLLTADLFQTSDKSAASKQPEYIQIFLGISKAELLTGTRKRSIEPGARKPFYLWAHIYQARMLRTTSSTGTSNPWVEIRMGAFSCKSEVKLLTSCPLYYSTLLMKTNLPPEDSDLSACPLVQVTVYHRNEDNDDEILGQHEFEPSEEWFVWPFTDFKPRRPASYTDIFCYLSRKRYRAGEILVTFDIFHPKLHEFHKHLLETSTTIKSLIGPDEILWSSKTLLRNTLVTTKQRNLVVSCMGLRDLQDLPGPWWSNGTIDTPEVRVKVGDTQKVLGSGNIPTPHNPNLFKCTALAIDWPDNPLFVPNVMVTCIIYKFNILGTKKERVVGSFEAALDRLLGDKEGTVKAPKATAQEIKFVLEENGLDPTVAADDEQEQDDDGNLRIPVGDQVDPQFEDLEETEEQEQDERQYEAQDKYNLKVDHQPVDKLPGEMEHQLTGLPYTKYDFLRALPPVFNIWSFSWDRTPRIRVAGHFKGRFTVDLTVLATPGSAKLSMEAEARRMKDIFIQTDILVRVYVYRGFYLIPVGRSSGDTNPILKLRTGEQDFADAQSYPTAEDGTKAYPNIQKTLTPSWRHTFNDIRMQVPGPSMLYLYVIDRQPGTFWGFNEDSMGFTKIDVEDRFYCRSAKWRTWNTIKEPDKRSEGKYVCVMPTEERTLYSDTSKGPQGKVEMFVCIHVKPPRDALGLIDKEALEVFPNEQYLPINIKGPGPMDFQLRTVIWEVKECQFPPNHEAREENKVGAACCAVDSVNIQVQAQAQWLYPDDDMGKKKLESTDVHYKSDDGKGLFNWRFVTLVTLPCKFHFLDLNVLDVFTLPFITPDCIASNTFNLKSFFTKAHKKPEQKVIIMKGRKPRGKPKEYLSLTHPKTGDDVRCKVLLDMDLIAVDYAARDDPNGLEQFSGEKAFSGGAEQLKRPKRPPTSFNPLNPIGWIRFLFYKYKYYCICCCCCIILIIALYLVLQFVVLKK